MDIIKDAEEKENVSESAFGTLNKDEWNYILSSSRQKFFAPNEIIITEGTSGREIYFILDGKVVISKISDTSGKEIQLNFLSKGHIIGEMAVITNKPRSATVKAMEETTVLVIDLDYLSKDSNAKEIYTKVMQGLALELSKKIFYFGDKLVRQDNLETSSFGDEYPDPPNIILVMFGWKWLDIMHEVPFLAEHGYDAIKISPPQEFTVRDGSPWWAMYQPVSYKLSSFYGTQEELIKMIDFCHGYGIKVYADLVINHMADFSIEKYGSTLRGTNGSTFSSYHYGPLNDENDYYNFDDFYHFDDQGGNRCISFEDYSTLEGAWHLEHYDFLNLPKLNLKNPHVIEILRKHIRKLLALGIDGFRLDAAKHLSMKSVNKILSGSKTNDGLKPFIYQEYYANAPMGIDLHSFMEKYFRVGYVTSFKYGEFLADAITGRSNNLQKLVEYSFGSSWIHYPENRTVTVIDNHDTERMMENMLSYKSNQNNAYVLAYIFMLAWPFGIPKIMSSFKFTSHDDSIPEIAVWRNGRCTCFDHDSPWVAQHRWNAIANMVLFRLKTKEAKGISHLWASGNQIAFARVSERFKHSVTSQGFVIINATDKLLKRRFETGLPSGKYCNLIAGHLAWGKMHGPLITIEKYGHAIIEVNPYDAVAIIPSFVD